MKKKIITFITKMDAKYTNTCNVIEEKTGVPAIIIAGVNGTIIGLMIRYFICKKYNKNFWLPGFQDK